MGALSITRVDLVNVRGVVPLFDAYRQFYGQGSDLEGARNFLVERLTKNESVMFVASEDGEAVGFAQLYPSFSSLSLKRVWILNDLYVVSAARGHGVGRVLLKECKQLAVETGAKELSLETMKSNLAAQHLYESQGWIRDEVFYRYHLPV